MASVFDTAVDQDQQRADALLELVKWASGVRGVQQLARSYGPAVNDLLEMWQRAGDPRGPIQGTLNAMPPMGPMAIAKGVGQLPTVLRAGGTGLAGGKAGMFGNLELPLHRLTRMARGIAAKDQDVPDIAQHGTKIALERMRTKSMGGPDVLRVARQGMKNWRQAETGAVGARRGDVRLVEKAQTQFGDQGHDVWLRWLQQEDPKGGWTLDKLRQVQAGTRRSTLRLDQRGNRRGQDVSISDSLAAGDNPEQAAEVRQAVRKLPKNLQSVAQQLASGELDPADVPQDTMSRLKRMMSGFDTGAGDIAEVPTKVAKVPKPIAEAESLIVEDVKKKRPLRGIAAKKKGTTLTPKPRPISGGSTGPDDPNIPPTVYEFPPHAFRNELRRQPAQQFGDEGFRTLNPIDRDLGVVTRALDRQLAEGGLSGGANLQEGHRTKGMMDSMTNNEAADMGEQYLALKALFGQYGRFSGKN